MAKKSLVGNIYGKIKPIEYIGNKRYKCQCIRCGALSEQYSSNLKGNMQCKKCGKGYKVDLTGKEFGFLTVKEYNKESKKWLCECRCGRKIEVKSNNLKNNNTSSCGKCKYVEAAKRDIVGGTRISQLKRKLIRKTNKNNKSGITGVGFNKRKNRWYAEIYFCGKKYWLGYYDSIGDAEKARMEAENNLYGDFLNWIKKIKNERNT